MVLQIRTFIGVGFLQERTETTENFFPNLANKKFVEQEGRVGSRDFQMCRFLQERTETTENFFPNQQFIEQEN